MNLQPLPHLIRPTAIYSAGDAQKFRRAQAVVQEVSDKFSQYGSDLALLEGGASDLNPDPGHLVAINSFFPGKIDPDIPVAELRYDKDTGQVDRFVIQARQSTLTFEYKLHDAYMQPTFEKTENGVCSRVEIDAKSGLLTQFWEGPPIGPK